MKSIIIVFSFLILTVHGQSSNWKEGELNPPKNGDGYGMVEQSARALESDEPEYKDLQTNESEESVESVESEESSDESTESSVESLEGSSEESSESPEESSEESSEDEMKVQMEPEVAIIGKFKLISRLLEFPKSTEIFTVS